MKSFQRFKPAYTFAVGYFILCVCSVVAYRYGELGEADQYINPEWLIAALGSAYLTIWQLSKTVVIDEHSISTKNLWSSRSLILTELTSAKLLTEPERRPLLSTKNHRYKDPLSYLYKDPYALKLETKEENIIIRLTDLNSSDKSQLLDRLRPYIISKAQNIDVELYTKISSVNYDLVRKQNFFIFIFVIITVTLLIVTLAPQS